MEINSTKLMTAPSSLSPAAQAVEDAYFNADGFGHRNGLAAALRAVADQVGIRQELLAIAAELEGAS